MAYCQTNKDKIGESLATSTIGFCYRGLGNTTRSLEYSIKGFEIGIETGNEIALAVAKAILAHCYKDTREYQQSIKYYLAVLEIGERVKTRK